MRLHVVGLPHTNTTKAYDWCAYTAKVRKFCSMMFDRGHSVYLYGGPENEARVTQHFVCTTDLPRNGEIPEFSAASPLFANFNQNAIEHISTHIEPDDVICIIGGIAQQSVARAFPYVYCVEFGVGYGGVFSDFKVFESYAWMHTVYGARSGGDAHAIDGQFFDAVIPNYYELEDFPFVEDKQDYLLYMGRLIDRKGFRLAEEVAREADIRLLVAGDGPLRPEYGEYVGLVGAEQRAQLMGNARALIAPTLYVEPFGGVTAEAMLCGTPVICTDWGAFPENIVQGITGFRCRMFAQFCQAVNDVKELDPRDIRSWAEQKFSTESVGNKYQQYFDQLKTLSGAGFYQR